MPALATLIAIATSAQVSPAPSPLFASFRAACSDVARFDGVDGAARGAGWREVGEAQADPRIVAILAKARAAAKDKAPDAMLSGKLYRQRIDGRQAWLTTSRVTFVQDGKPVWANGCRAYDLDASTAPTREAATAWVGTAPTGSQSSGSAIKWQWSPWQADTALEISYVPRDNPLGVQFGIQGLILVSQAIGGF